jgi:hypothetical protein
METAVTPIDVQSRLVKMFPEFAQFWDKATNCHRDADGGFTLWGVFAEFSHYFREHFTSFSASTLATLGAFLEECMASPGSDLDNAAATCFLENVAGEESAAALRPHLSRRAQDFLGQ